MAARWAVGVDVGGTTIKTVVSNAAGQAVLRRTDPTPHGAQEVVATVARVVSEVDADLEAGRVREGARALAPEEVVHPVGVDVPGIVDEDAGVAVLSVNLGWGRVPMRLDLERALGRPVSLGHDVRSGAWAESRWGAAGPHCVYLALGTGLAAAVVLDGRPVVSGGWAGEVGQMLVPDPDSPGSLARLEDVVSAGALARRWARSRPAGTRGRVVEEGALGVLREVERGDAEAARVWDTGLDALAELVARTACLLGPVDVVIGGGLAGAGRARLVEPLRNRVADLLTVCPPPRVLVAGLGPWSQALGSAGRALAASGEGG
ncbi:ROK family protein [Actinomyces howellii]|uniref:Glucokinase n=1 Tax=Actinomyces howellii TaxID=52771 RepID=A0A448HDN6_9ACTO|nr:ROK family protein [Actinomyces howellii]VEG25638.1 Glucokinase [Actinomyces howellii]